MKLATKPFYRLLRDVEAAITGKPVSPAPPTLTDEEQRALAWFQLECEDELRPAYIQRQQGRWVIRVPRAKLTMFSGDHETQRQLVLHAYRTVLNT